MNNVPLKNSWRLLTGVGEAAVHVVSLRFVSQEVKNFIAQSFRPKTNLNSNFQLGILLDGQGNPVDELFLERRSQEIRFHIHGGRQSFECLTNLLNEWGCVSDEGYVPKTLEEEIGWALKNSPTEKASALLAAQYEYLPKINCLEELLGTYSFGKSLLEPTTYSLMGPPNAGKSSLLNRVIGDKRTVVSPIAGTTRDVIDISFEADGRLIQLVDGAGLRETDNNLEKSGQRILKKIFIQSEIIAVHNPHSKRPVILDEAVALVLTHQDLGPGKHPSFDGPIIKSSIHDKGEGFKSFVTSQLPEWIDGPVIFTKRQYSVVKKMIKSGEFDQRTWEKLIQ